MLKRIAPVVALGLLLSNVISAQEVKPASKEGPERPATPATRRDPPQPINVKLDLTITDQSGPGEAVKRTVSMIVADQQRGNVVSSGRLNLENKGLHEVVLNVDAVPTLLENNRIRLSLTIDYAPKPGTDNATSGEGRSRVNQRLGLIVEPGKPMLISQASDPTSDRKISVELLATILK